jgi:hypothetical protein
MVEQELQNGAQLEPGGEVARRIEEGRDLLLLTAQGFVSRKFEQAAVRGHGSTE